MYGPKRSQSKRHSLGSVVSALKGANKSRSKPRGKISKPKTYTGVDYISKEKADQLRQTVRELMRPGLGIFAADDSVDQLDLKLKAINLENTQTNRRLYHELLLDAAPADEDWMKACFSGVLMREEYISEPGFPGKKLTRLIQERSVLLGVRYDKGVEKLIGCDREYISRGLDLLTCAINRTKWRGVKFGLFRCVFRISELTPSRQAIVENSLVLAKFAVICQHTAIVPIVAVDVLAEGNYGPQEARGALREILSTLVKILKEHRVYFEGLLIRVAACQPGICCKLPRDLERVANDTWKTLNECIPPAVGGVFLSRGEDLCTSLSILNNMQLCRIQKPFFLSFCYSRVIQTDVLALWAGQAKNLAKARAQLIKNAEKCSLASFGHLREVEGIDIKIIHNEFVCKSSYIRY